MTINPESSPEQIVSVSTQLVAESMRQQGFTEEEINRVLQQMMTNGSTANIVAFFEAAIDK